MTMPSSVDEQFCLHCGESKKAVQAHKLACEIWGGYEYYELEYEWPKHRWISWSDADLAYLGIKPEAYDKYRRTSALNMQWIACEDLLRGHSPVKDEEDIELFSGPIGRCMLCGKLPEESKA